MSSLNNLFQRPTAATIGGVSCELHKLSFESFASALAFGTWLNEEQVTLVRVAMALKANSPVADDLMVLLADCLRVPGEPQLKKDDLKRMPVVTLVEAALAVIEDNLDFFIQALPTMATKLAGLTTMSLTGLASLNSLSPQATIPTRSGDTASGSSEAS